MRTVMLGGSFDPIHLGHLKIIKALLEQTDFTRILIIPVHIPPHKEPNGLVPDDVRVEMISLALGSLAAQGIPEDRQLMIDQCELNRGGVSYTIDTVHHIQSTYQITGRLGVVIGDDLIQGLRAWASWERLATEVEFIVADRVEAGSPVVEMPIESHYRRLSGIDLPVSSSQVRLRRAQGWDISGLVPEAVAALIGGHGIYTA